MPIKGLTPKLLCQVTVVYSSFSPQYMNFNNLLALFIYSLLSSETNKKPK